MKEIFLSFRPEYYDPILYGLKKYEYRKRFCQEESIAYLYLSGKRKEVVGILKLGFPIDLRDIRNTLENHKDTQMRVDRYIENRDIFAVPIESLSLFDRPISLDEIRSSIAGFMPPQMYYILDNQPKLKEILKSRSVQKPEFIHSHDEIYYDNLALSVSEIENTEEYKQIKKNLVR